MNKKSFVMYSSWIPLFEGLDDEKAGQLIKAICTYQNDPTAEPTDPVIAAVFSMIKVTLDADKAKYEAKCQKNAANASTRWDKDTNECERIQTHTNASKRKKTHSDNDSDSEYDSDSESDNESPTETKKKRGASPRPTLEDVRAYCLERGNNVNPETFIDFYTAKGWMIGKNTIKDWKACVRTWEKREAGRASPPQAQSVDDYLMDIINGGGT